MSASISQLIPELQPFAHDLVNAAGAAGLQPKVTSTRRSRAEQTRLYRRFQQGLNAYPVAAPGTSAHEFGFAFDMVVTPIDAITDVGRYWKEQGGVWGGEFNDPIHFEYPGFKAAQSERVEIPGVGVFNTVLDWINSLPWYVQLLIPAKLMNAPTTKPEEIMKILRDAGAI